MSLDGVLTQSRQTVTMPPCDVAHTSGWESKMEDAKRTRRRWRRRKEDQLNRALTTLAAATFLILGQVAMASGVQAKSNPLPPTPEPVVSTGSATVETYTDNFKKLVSTVTYGPETEGQLMPAEDVGAAPGDGIAANAGGSAGSSSASGCQRVTVNNEAETVLGFTAYWFHTWTRWCWTRSTQVVYDVSTGWFLSDVDSQQYWRGIINSELGFYDYSTNDGHPKSAYKHYRQGRFENCVLKYGCIGTTYPANTLRSYYNGTWAWETNG